MFVVTTGRGNIDLSIPSVVTLAAYVTVTVSGGSDAGLPLDPRRAGGARRSATGLVNAALVVLLRIPAIIATLATGYMLATLTLLVNRAGQVGGHRRHPRLPRDRPPRGACPSRHSSASRSSCSPGSCSPASPTAGRSAPSARTGTRPASPASASAAASRSLSCSARCLATLTGVLLSAYAGRRLPRDGHALPAAVGRCGGARRHADRRRLRHRARHRCSGRCCSSSSS